VCIDYLKAKELVAEVVARTQGILDVRLAATRLRQAHPSPRLTIPAAEEQLSSQIRDMQMLGDRLQSINRKVALVKEAVKEGTVEMDHLRSEKAELEKKVAAHKVEADDGRAVDLCDWCAFLDILIMID
jgi:predicted  nucleic acid-binding Zn-ribbon protein